MTQRTFTLSVPLDSCDEADPRTSRLQPDPNAPLPLGYPAVVQRAMQLRRRGSHWSWTALADAMGEYHGFWRAPSWWMKQINARSPERRARGGAFVSGDPRAFHHKATP